jgi:hypothetical protein
MEDLKMDFVCGWYEVKWLDQEGKEVKKEVKYLNALTYNREIMKMQTAFLYGMQVEKLTITPIEK